MKGYSDETNEIIDEEIHQIITECTERTKALVAEHANKIDALAKILIAKETIDTRDIEGVLGARPFEPKKNYRKYL